jgi:uncharacterized cupin superfamily protein
MSIDPSEQYVHLTGGGSAEVIPGGEHFWSRPEAEMDQFGQNWLISEFECSSDWSNWEMHPNADEFVYLLSGSVELLLEQATGVQSVILNGRGAVVIPRGIWHTAKVPAASRMLFVTMGSGTEHRPSAANVE